MGREVARLQWDRPGPPSRPSHNLVLIPDGEYCCMFRTLEHRLDSRADTAVEKLNPAGTRKFADAGSMFRSG